MDDKQLEEIIQYAECGWYDSEAAPVTYAPSFVAARADLAAMRTPITAEALLAAGWERQYKTVDAFWRMPGHHLFIEDGTIKIWIGRVDGVWASTNAQTMHDLAQLVRLLGGAQ